MSYDRRQLHLGKLVWHLVANLVAALTVATQLIWVQWYSPNLDGLPLVLLQQSRRPSFHSTSILLSLISSQVYFFFVISMIWATFALWDAATHELKPFANGYFPKVSAFGTRSIECSS
jgi:hypothetical protein